MTKKARILNTPNLEADGRQRKKLGCEGLFFLDISAWRWDYASLGQAQRNPGLEVHFSVSNTLLNDPDNVKTMERSDCAPSSCTVCIERLMKLTLEHTIAGIIHIVLLPCRPSR